MKALIYSFITLTAISAISCKEDVKTTSTISIPQQDKVFIAEAGTTHQAQIEYGQIAAQKSSNELVRRFGERMITEGQVAQSDLISVGDILNAPPATTLTTEQQAKKSQLQGLSGFAFDTAYMHCEIRTHLRSNAAFETTLASEEAPDPLKQYCDKSLGTIKLQLAQADSIWNLLAPDKSAARVIASH